MRLIDADKLVEICRKGWKLFGRDDEKLKHWVDENDIREQPTVKAIPIETIKKEIERLKEDIKWAWYYGNTALEKMEYLERWLEIKLEDWEKENEQTNRC